MLANFLKMSLGLPLLLAACSTPIPPSQTPQALKDLSADGIFVFMAEEECADVSLNERQFNRRIDDVTLALIEKGYTYDQISAMLDGLERDQEWFFTYIVQFSRKHDVDLSDDGDMAGFCRAMRSEKRSRTAIGRLMA